MNWLGKSAPVVGAIVSVFLFFGCNKASKYERILKESEEIELEIQELHKEVLYEYSVKEFKMLSESEQEKLIKLREDKLVRERYRLKRARELAKEAKRKIRNAKNKSQLERIIWGF